MKQQILVFFMFSFIGVTPCTAEDRAVVADKTAHYSTAMNYRQDKKFDLAEKEYSQLLMMEPKNPELYCSRAFMRLEQKKFKEALEDASAAERLTTLNGRLFWIAMIRGRAYAGLHDLKSAVKYYLEACNRQPGRADAPFELGELYYKNKQGQEALLCLNNALNILSSARKNERIQKQIDDAKEMISKIESSRSKRKNKEKSGKNEMVD